MHTTLAAAGCCTRVGAGAPSCRPTQLLGHYLTQSHAAPAQVGIFVADMPSFNNIDEGTYALLGAASFLGGSMRMTVRWAEAVVV